MFFNGKKLLIVGGAFQHCKLVQEAHKMGVTVYVTDYLPVEKAPAKQIADKHYEYNITEIDNIVSMCKREHIDGVLSSHLDACQLPYQEICEKLKYPCFGTREQFNILTNKKAFLDTCVKNGLDIIPQYSEDDFGCFNEKIEYPILVKPCDSRGSRGQTICRTFSEVKDSISFAKTMSRSKKVVIEKYMENKRDLQIVYFVIDGYPFLIRISDIYVGATEFGLDRLCIGAVSPSNFTEIYLKNTNDKVIKFIQNIGIKTGPIFLQGFIDEGTVRFYDPGLRCAGGEYETLFEKIMGVSIISYLIEFALSGHVSNYEDLKKTPYLLNGKYIVQNAHTLLPGTIKSIDGVDAVRNMSGVYSISSMSFQTGSIIGQSADIGRRMCVINMIADSKADISNKLTEVKTTLKVLDVNNNSMIASILEKID